MEPRIYRVGEHATLLALRTNRFKSECFGVRFAVPIAALTAQRYSVLLHLLRRGTARFTTKASFDRHMDDLYASSISASTKKLGDMQLLEISADFLGARYVGGGLGLLPEVMEMTGDLLYRPYLPGGCFHPPYLEAEKIVLRDSLRAEINAPRSFARSRCAALLLENEPHALRLAGELDTVDALDASDLTALWQDMIRDLTPTFTYVGDSAPEAVVELIEKHFQTGKRPFAYLQPRNAMPLDPKRATQDMPISQGRLAIGYRTDIFANDPLAPALRVAETIYGGSAASKLFLNVRERRSLCYYCSSRYTSTKGALIAEAGIRPDHAEIAEEAIKGEMQALCRGEISEGELNAAKRYLDHSAKRLYDSPVALASYYLNGYMMGDTQSIEEMRERIQGVGRDAVIEAASHFREGAVFYLNATATGEEAEDE